MRLLDYRNLGDHRTVRFRAKGAKDREIPVRDDLEGWLREYIAAAAIEKESRTAPLFRAAVGESKALTGDRYDAHSLRQMLNVD